MRNWNQGAWGTAGWELRREGAAESGGVVKERLGEGAFLN